MILRELRELPHRVRYKAWLRFLRWNSSKYRDGADEWEAMDEIAEKVVRQNPAADRRQVREMIDELRTASIF